MKDHISISLDELIELTTKMLMPFKAIIGISFSIALYGYIYKQAEEAIIVDYEFRYAKRLMELGYSKFKADKSAKNAKINLNDLNPEKYAEHEVSHRRK